MSTDTHISYSPSNDYAQSANTLFHFMKNPEYLTDILQRKAIIPRYCRENIDYLDLRNGEHKFNEIAILQKCFCDIPFHKFADTFTVEGTGDIFNSLSQEQQSTIIHTNTHFDYYGEYAIAFSKSWGETHNLQPIHYLNKDTQHTKDFSALLNHCFSEKDIPSIFSNDAINRLTYIKPLRGIMKRDTSFNTSQPVEIYKNFHDEREWRYVPSINILAPLKLKNIIANPALLSTINITNEQLKDELYKNLWLTFSYDDIRYIIVPNTGARIDIIKTILELSESCFENKTDISMQKNILISKILVLEEIRKDW